MDFLHFVCEKLGLKNISETEVNETKAKVKINISFNNFSKRFLDYLIFSGVYSLFFILSYVGNIKINIILTFILWFMALGIIIIIRKRLLKRGPQPKNINIYNRELPDNLTPAHARLLVYDGVVDSYTIVSTILDLINRGYLKIENDNKESLFHENCYLYKTDKSLDDLFDYEIYLINWLFENQNNSSQITSLANSQTYNFAIFQGLVFSSFPFTKYYEKKANNFVKYLLFSFGLFFIYLNLNHHLNSLILLIVCEFICFLTLGYSMIISSSYTLNANGVEIRDSYLDLKRFLKDFSSIREKNSEMVMLWDFYISYSVALNLNGTAYNEINNLIDEDCFYTYKNILYDDLHYSSNYENILNRSQILYSKRK